MNVADVLRVENNFIKRRRMPLANLPRIDQPREKLVYYGPEKLSDEELLAIILRTGTSGEM